MYLSFLEALVIQVHSKGNGYSFVKDWQDYKVGFGTIEDQNYWMGLENIHQLTKSGSYGLEIILTHQNGTEDILKWNYFSIGSEADKYMLSSSGFNPGTTKLSDWLGQFNGIKFSTRDQDNDELVRPEQESDNCALIHGGTGWWFKYCYISHLNLRSGPHWRPNSYYLSRMILRGKSSKNISKGCYGNCRTIFFHIFHIRINCKCCLFLGLELTSFNGHCRYGSNKRRKFSYIENVESAKRCYKECRIVIKCVAFSFTSDDKDCNLYEGGPYTHGNGKSSSMCYLMLGRFNLL